MKRVLSIVSIFFCVSAVYAQSEKPVEERLSELEKKTEVQSSVLSSLSEKINSVTKQNLALKEALSLKPVVAEYSTEEFTYKVHEVKGDSLNKEVHVLMTINNTTDKDIKQFQMSGVKFMDEFGIQNQTLEDFKHIVGGNNDGWSINQIYADSPTQLEIILYNYNPESSYVKILDVEVHNSSVTEYVPIRSIKRNFTLRNLPIKWQ